MTHDLELRQEPVRIVTRVGALTREADGGIRGDETEAVPTISPGLGDPSAFEHEVLDTRRRQLVAHGEAGLPGADDDHVHGLGQRR